MTESAQAIGADSCIEILISSVEKDGVINFSTQKAIK